MKLEEELKTNKFESVSHKAHLNILFTAAHIRTKVSHTLKPFKITAEQFNVLRILRGQHPNSICMMEVAARMLDKNSNVTRIAEKLLNKGFIGRNRSAADKREVKIEILEPGLQLLKELDLAFEKQQPHKTNLSEAQAAQLNELLDLARG
jgi:DNA-binding MarR family transcriptional regulator